MIIKVPLVRKQFFVFEHNYTLIVYYYSVLVTVVSCYYCDTEYTCTHT